MDAPEQFRVARRALEELPFCRIVEDLTAFEACWTLHIAVTIDSHGEIPRQTEWYVVLPHNYPYGDITIFPSKSNGITKTYPHQAHNYPEGDKALWLSGKPCVSSSLRTMGRREYDIEPMSTEGRLAWHVNRLKQWLEYADAGMLLKKGDPFELPEYPNTIKTENIGFVGSEGTIGELEEESWDRFGSVLLHRITGEGDSHVWIPIEFRNMRGQTVSSPNTDYLPERKNPDIFAIWVRVPRVPHIEPWRGIRTYRELRDAIKCDGIDFDQVLRHFSTSLRDGKQHVFMIGCPVPEKVGGEHGRWFWLAILLPILAHGRISGFRNNAQSYSLYDKQHALADHEEIKWMKSSSWQSKDILGRGCFDPSLVAKKVLVIGLGAVGAFVAELLVRAGVKQLVLVDYDRIEIGNLTRHTATIREIGEYKVNAIGRRLKMAEPHVAVKVLPCSFHDATKQKHETISSCDLIIDCTGDDSLLYDLSRVQFNEPKLFASISLGLGAKQVFVFCAKESVFPADRFVNCLTPYLARERDEAVGIGYELPRDGIGCWHPVFPARCDDVWMMTSAAIKIVESFVLGNEQMSGLTVMRQKVVNGVSCGIERAVQNENG